MGVYIFQKYGNSQPILYLGKPKWSPDFETIHHKERVMHWVQGSIENTRYICEWRNSDCLWLQRASCVTFVNPERWQVFLPSLKAVTRFFIKSSITALWQFAIFNVRKKILKIAKSFPIENLIFFSK